jgi:hypothetical protein
MPTNVTCGRHLLPSALDSSINRLQQTRGKGANVWPRFIKGPVPAPLGAYVRYVLTLGSTLLGKALPHLKSIDALQLPDVG